MPTENEQVDAEIEALNKLEIQHNDPKSYNALSPEQQLDLGKQIAEKMAVLQDLGTSVESDVLKDVIELRLRHSRVLGGMKSISPNPPQSREKLGEMLRALREELTAEIQADKKPAPKAEEPQPTAEEHAKVPETPEISEEETPPKPSGPRKNT